MTTVLDRFDFLQRLSLQHKYSASMTPSEFADCYQYLAVPLPDNHMVFLRVTQYRIGLPADARAEKSRLLRALRRAWARGELIQIRAWASGRGGEGRIMRPFNGKAMPEEMILTCLLAVITGEKTADDVATWAETHFGLDCSGFVNNYFIATGRLQAHRTILDYANPESRRISDVSEIGPKTVLTWAHSNGRVMSGPGHIAVVDNWTAPPTRLRVVESSSSLDGLNIGEYEILKDPSETGRRALWQVRRPHRRRSFVYFVPSP